MLVELVRYTPDPEQAIIEAASMCWKSVPRPQILNHLIASRHFSPLEFASFNFRISEISRACSHQLVRKRIGIGFAQESQRYVVYNVYDNGFDYVIPHSIAKNVDASGTFKEEMFKDYDAYSELIEMGIPAEDARFLLPNAAATSMMLTANARCLIDLASERLCTKAQWEIRELVNNMKELVSKVAPRIAAAMQPKCHWLKHCPEKKGCGIWKTYLTSKDSQWVKDAYEHLNI